MLKNHILFALRLFRKESVYSTLNTIGLTLGISVGIILFLYLQSELSYDKYYKNYDQIYRFTNHLQAQGADFNTAFVSRRMGPILKADYPEVIDYAIFIPRGRPMVSSETEQGIKQFYEEEVYAADSTVFKVFDHTFIEGNPATCLDGPGKIVLTKSIAEKYFGNQKALGKRLLINNEDSREVTAIIEDLPQNTHLRYEILLSGIEPITWDGGDKERYSEVFWNPGSYLYLLLPKDYNAESFYEKFPAIFDKTFGVFGERIGGSVTPQIQRLDKIHFDSNKTGDQPTGSIRYVYTFASVGIFIILLACINYMNLATARSATRTGEIGIRKVLGNSRLGLFTNVMIEALLMSVFAMFLAIFTVFLLLEFTPFNTLIGKELHLNFLSNYSLVFSILGITLLIGLLSGIYPALYIPSVPVVTAIKGVFTSDKTSVLLRKILITFQFVISLVVIICTVMMDRQVNYMRDKELGFNTQNTILLEVQDSLTESRIQTISNELQKNPNVLGTTNSYGVPGRGVHGSVMWIEQDTGSVQQDISILYAGKGYLDLMGIEIVEGRAFNEDSEADYRNAFLANEAAAKAFGWGENAVGKKVKYFHQTEFSRIVGVYKNFNFESLHNPIQPLLIKLDRDQGGTFYVKIRNEDMTNTLRFIEETWSKFDTQHSYDYSFLNEEYARQYEQEQTQQRLISLLSYISIIISLLGLIGLSAYTASQKAKEISIRKVLGANVSSIVLLFSKEYILLIIIALVISIPVADYAIVEWMSEFAYQMPISWMYFAIPGGIVIILGLVTVAFQSLRSAKADPISGLRKD